MSRRVVLVAAILVLAIAAAWVLFIGLPRWYAPRPVTGSDASPAEPGTERKITATLYYVAENGMSLVGAQREVTFDEPIARQARRIVEAQLAGPPSPLATAIPQGTRLRALYLTERGDAFVDLSGEVRSNHPGGALEELFTIYSIVDALTVNLPAIARVQILIDGKEVDTLAGHVDLRHPLQKSLKWVDVGNRNGAEGDRPTP
jgi:spore germination protein GerM